MPDNGSWNLSYCVLVTFKKGAGDLVKVAKSNHCIMLCCHLPRTGGSESAFETYGVVYIHGGQLRLNLWWPTFRLHPQWSASRLHPRWSTLWWSASSKSMVAYFSFTSTVVSFSFISKVVSFV